MPETRVVIVGNGIAGISAALRLRELNSACAVTVVSEETELFFSRTALMYVYMRQLQFKDTVVHPADYYRKKNINLIFAKARAIDTAARRLALIDGNQLAFDFLLLATGSQPRRPGLKGETLAGVQGLYSRADLETLEAKSAKGIAHAVIAGGGLIGVELAEMLTHRKIPVTFLVREDLYFGSVLPPAEAQLVTAEVKCHVRDLRLSTTLAGIEGKDAITAVTTSAGERINCSFLGLTIGVEPRTELAATAQIQTGRGILTDPYLQTSVPGIFAAGDAAEVALPAGQKRVQQIWYSGRAQGETAGENIAAAIAGKPLTAYDCGIYFNSARFFTLDYQVYGKVPVAADNKNSLYSQNASGTQAIRICFGEAADRPVTGFHVFGLRLRHEVCERWIANALPLAQVMADFERAVFDPEFSRRYAAELRKLL